MIRNLHGILRYIKRNIRRGGQFFIFSIITIFIILESVQLITISWQAVALLVVAAVITLLDDIEKLDLGEFGGIELSKDIDQVQERVDSYEHSTSGVYPSNRPTEDRYKAEDDEAGGRTLEIAARLYQLFEESPRLALIQLRLELEQAMNEAIDEKTSMLPDQMNKEGVMVKTIDQEFVDAYTDVISVCNKAIHFSDTIEEEEAARVIDLGLRVLDHIKYQR